MKFGNPIIIPSRQALSTKYLGVKERPPLVMVAIEGRFWEAEVLREQRLEGVGHPVGNAEGAELGEVAVVEDQDEVAWLVAQALEHVAVAAREKPHVPRVEVVRLGITPR
jgi:hypothetical protein